MAYIGEVKEHDLVSGKPAPLGDPIQARELRLGEVAEEFVAKHRDSECDARNTPSVKRAQIRKTQSIASVSWS